MEEHKRHKNFSPMPNSSPMMPQESPSKYHKSRNTRNPSFLERISLIQLLAIGLIVYAFLDAISIGRLRRGARHETNQTPTSMNILSPTRDGYYALGVASGGSPGRVVSFVLSWAKYAPQTHLVIWTDPQLLENDEVAAVYKEFNVKAIPFTPPSVLPDPLDASDFKHWGNPALHRLMQYSDYLERNSHNVRAVALITAADDTILQGDPWIHPLVQKSIATGSILSTVEGGQDLGSLTIQEDASLQRTMQDCFGKGIALKAAEESMLNNDVLFGSGYSAMMYLRDAKDIVGARSRPFCMRNIRPDVAAHNYIAHIESRQPKSLAYRLTVATYADSPIFCSAYGMPAIIDARGLVVRQHEHTTEAGVSEYPLIVVQYTSHPELMEHIQKEYKIRGPEKQLGFAQRGGYLGEELVDKPLVWWKQDPSPPAENQEMVEEEGLEDDELSKDASSLEESEGAQTQGSITTEIDNLTEEQENAAENVEKDVIPSDELAESSVEDFVENVYTGTHNNGAVGEVDNQHAEQANKAILVSMEEYDKQ